MITSDSVVIVSTPLHSPLPPLQRVLFDPLSYLHPRRISLAARLLQPARARAVANELALAIYQLDTNDLPTTSNYQQHLWLHHWWRLPQAAYLLGCHGQKEQLARQGGWLQLPAWARHFAAINLPSALDPPSTSSCTHLALLHAGYSQLLAWSETLPCALAQRLPLLFTPELDRLPPLPARADPLLLTLALQHAQRNPHPLPRDVS
ncbi:MAG: type III secretion apparatus protein OrgA/MxiK [Plesiomonas sp.]|uniref:type III secretion apparatus protein OrgA/MxiK n=1 Tax=Plesiomonas sp. TaxID=2486279 RepID=UPI003F2FB074